MKRFGKKFRRFAAAIGLALVVDLALPLIAESTTPFVVKFIGSLIGDLFKKDTPPYEPNVNSPVPSDGESRKLAQNPDSCFALFIGVDAYDSAPNLSYSSSDAKALRDAVLKLGFRNENIWLCVSDGSRRELPTKKNVDAALADMLAAAEEAGDDATIFISLSGHGFETPEGAAAFCPKDAVVDISPGKPTTVTRESAVLIDDLMKKLREHRARFKMLIVDACRSPAQMKGNDGYERSFRIDDVPSGIAFLQSCGSGEASYEDAEFRRSVFTHYFIEGLEGKAENKDGGVTFADLCDYAARQTQARVETAYKGKQTPVFSISGVNFVLKESTLNAAEALYREGRALAWGIDGTKIDGARALDLLTQAAEAGSSDAQAALALLYYDGCEATPPDFKKAVEWANRAGENPIAQNVLGDCFRDGLAVSKDEAEAKRLHEAAFKRFQELAESGDPMILNQLGRCYCNGRGTPVNFVEAAKYYRLAAERCAISVVNLGDMLANGLGVERDEAEAKRLYNVALEANCSFAYVWLGDYYTQSSELDFKRAAEYYRQAAEKNNAGGAAALGYCYANGWGVEKKPKEAVRLYRQAFEWNSALGTFLLAESLLNGTGCEKNQREALKLFERAAEQDCWQAFSRVADCYENAWGTLKNEEYANEWRERLFLKYQEYAEAGASSSMNNLGDCYRNGAGVEKDEAKAVEWYRKAAEKGDALGWYNLGDCYYYGEGVEENNPEAVKYFRKAEEGGMIYAKYRLGECYRYGYGVDQDYAEALRLYREAAEKNVADAMNVLGICYDLGQGVEKNEAEEFRWYQKAADENHYLGLYNLAICYANGEGVEKDEVKAFELYRRSADLGYADAIQSLGDCYFLGRGVTQDNVEAIRLWREAAAKNNGAACWRLGECYYYGDRGVEENNDEAVKWYRKGVELNNAASMDSLGYCYAMGHGVEKDEKEAVRWYLEAAKLNYSSAMNKLGVCYAVGEGVEKDIDEAMRWYRKAADLGNAWSAYNLAVNYLDKDEAEATRWYCKAAELGNADGAYEAGIRYARGEHVDQNWDEAAKYLSLACELEYAQALTRVGTALVFEALAKAQKRANVDLLGEEFFALEEGYRNLGNALTKKDAENYMPTGGLAQVVGLLDAENGAESDVKKGVKYLKQAVELEDKPACWILGACYFYGVGVERDFNQAEKYLYQAASSDDETVKKGAKAALENWEEKVEKMEAAAKSLEEELENFEKLLNWEGEEQGEADSTEKTSDEGNAPAVAS